MKFRHCRDVFTLSVSRIFFFRFCNDNCLFSLTHCIFLEPPLNLYNFQANLKVKVHDHAYVAEALEMEGLSLSDTEAPKTSSIAWLDILYMRDLAQHEFVTEVFRLSWPNVTKYSKIRFSFFIILTATNRYFTITWNRVSTATWLTHARNMGEESVRLHSRTIYQQFICREFSYKFWQSAWPKECLPNLDNTIMYNPGQKS